MSYTKIFIFASKNDKKWYITKLYSANIMIYVFFQDICLRQVGPPAGLAFSGGSTKNCI